MRAIALLVFFQVRRALIQIATDPRKLIPTVIVLGIYVYGMTHRSPLQFPIQASTNPQDWANLAHDIGGFLIFVLGFVSISTVSQGCSAAYLGYSVPDIDYVMASPIPRRLVLGLKFLKLTVGAFGFTALLWLMFHSFAGPFFPPVHARFNFGELALFCCIAGIGNVGLAISAHIGKRRVGFLAAQMAALVLFVIPLVILKMQGVDQAVSFLNSRAMAWIFFPCKWAIDSMLLPYLGKSSDIQVLELIAFYAATLVLIFAKPANFYETAFYITHDMEQLREARVKSAGTGDSLVLYAREYEKKAQRANGKRLYSLPAFGTGAAAILWANLCCAFKRPWLNFGFPAALGVLLGSIDIYDQGAISLPLVTTFVVGFFIATSGLFAYLPLIQRRSILGPLPITPWKMACADIVEFAIICCLPIFTMAATLAIAHVPGMSNLVILFFTCVPIVIVGIAAIPYIQVTLTPAMGQDPVIQGVAGLSVFLAIPVACALYLPMLLVPAQAGFAPWFVNFVALPGCILITGLMLSLAGRCYSYMRAEGDGRKLTQVLSGLSKAGRRLPDLDEGLWMSILLLAITAYNPIWLAKYGFIVLVIGNETLYLGLALMFAWVGRYDWRKVFSWSTPSFTKIAGGLLIGLGTLPWMAVVNVIVLKVWHPNMAANNDLMHYFGLQLASHPILTPLVAAAMAGICEEMTFRGVVQTALVRRLGPKWGILLTGFLFAAWHLDYFGLASRTIIGIGLGWIVWRGKSIFPAMLAHFAIDATAFGWYSYIVHTKGVSALHVGVIPTLHLTPGNAGILAGALVALVIGWLLIEKTSEPMNYVSKDAILAAT